MARPTGTRADRPRRRRRGRRAVIRVARETGLELVVRSGGHNGAGHGTTDGGWYRPARHARADVDPAARTAWAETGLTAAEVATAAAEHGLAIGFGDTGSVGIGGITLGGGIGYLVRRDGLTIDNLARRRGRHGRGPDPPRRRDDDPDLFWAIRGGGGNFGVATRFQYRLTPRRTSPAASSSCPATAETRRGVHRRGGRRPRRAVDDRERHAVPADAVRRRGAPRRDRDPRDARLVRRRATRERRSRRSGPSPSRSRTCRPTPYPEMFPPEDPDYRPTAVVRPMFLDNVDLAAATDRRALRASDAPLRVQLRALGGAMARCRSMRRRSRTAIGRSWPSSRVLRGAPSGRPSRPGSTRPPWTWARTGAYVNFVNDEGRPEFAPPTPGRGTDWRHQGGYDPTNLFHRNQNCRRRGARPGTTTTVASRTGDAYLSRHRPSVVTSTSGDARTAGIWFHGRGVPLWTPSSWRDSEWIEIISDARRLASIGTFFLTLGGSP